MASNLDRVGRDKVLFKSDQEESIVAHKRRAAWQRKTKTIREEGPVVDSNANLVIEMATPLGAEAPRTAPSRRCPRAARR